jgi:uncharacterized protein Yka (UPF0111/DUF47 family)
MFENPKTEIFELLNTHAALALKSSGILIKLTKNWAKLPNYAQEMLGLEDEADKIVEQITSDIEKRFILPLDKEDAKNIAETLDNIIDDIENFTNRCLIFDLRQAYPGLEDFAQIIHEAIEKIQKGVLLIAKAQFDGEEFISIYHRVRTLEKQGDRHYRKVLAKIMKNPHQSDSLEQIWEKLKWREVWAHLERVLDKCEAMAILFELLRIKYE